MESNADKVRNGTEKVEYQFFMKTKNIGFVQQSPTHHAFTSNVFGPLVQLILAHKLVENKILPLQQGQIKEHDLGPEEAPHTIEFSHCITI